MNSICWFSVEFGLSHDKFIVYLKSDVIFKIFEGYRSILLVVWANKFVLVTNMHWICWSNIWYISMCSWQYEKFWCAVALNETSNTFLERRECCWNLLNDIILNLTISPLIFFRFLSHETVFGLIWKVNKKFDVHLKYLLLIKHCLCICKSEWLTKYLCKSPKHHIIIELKSFIWNIHCKTLI